jgi:hypothetical protein
MNALQWLALAAYFASGIAGGLVIAGVLQWLVNHDYL